MEHSFQLIAERAKEAKSGNYETINLLYNLHYELHPESNDNDFVELTYAIFAAVRAAEMGIPSPVPIPAGFVYTPNDNKTDDPSLSERAKELIKLLRAQLAPEKPYADIIQEVALSKLETALYILGEQYCWFAEPNALREVSLGLQERINEYTLSGNANDKHVKTPRLEHAVNWLQSYEKQLVNYLEQQPNIIAPAAPATTEPLDTPAFTVIKSQAQVLSEMIAQIATDAEASANAKGFTLVGKPGNPVPPPPPQPLDNPPPPPLTERLPIDDVLAMPRAALDLILLDAAMIEPDTIPGRYKAKPTVKPWQWANVRAALQTKLLLAEINDEDAALLFTETYGAKVGRGTMQKRPQNEQNSKFKTRRIFAYAEFRDRLPASNPS